MAKSIKLEYPCGAIKHHMTGMGYDGPNAERPVWLYLVRDANGQHICECYGIEMTRFVISAMNAKIKRNATRAQEGGAE